MGIEIVGDSNGTIALYIFGLFGIGLVLNFLIKRKKK